MIDLIIDLVTPMLVSFGASAADVASYLISLSTYIYVILGSLLVMVVLMVAAHWFKKGCRHVVRWTAAIAWVLVVLLVVNMICYGPMHAIVSGFLNASKAEMSDDVVGNSQEVIRKIGDEGMVLVKNDGLLPLAADNNKLNVFGWTSVNPIYAGTGSGNAGEAMQPISLLLSLRDAGFSMNDELTRLYLDYCQTRPTISMNSQDWTLPEPTRGAYTDELLSNATAFSDTAMVVIGRSGGENADLPADMNAVIKGTYDVAKTDVVDTKFKGNYGYTAGTYKNNGDYDDFEPGEHYLELSRTEEDLVDMVCSNFKNVIVVINANNAMELDWVDKYDNIGAVILAPGAGNTGMAALGRILNGTVNPSGKTVDTYLKDLTLAPTYNHSGNSGMHIYTETGDLIKKVGRNDLSFQGVFSFTDYVEGIYMGYKFYETAAEEGLINYEEYVQYPFGYGLSYTTFEQEISEFKQNKTSLTVEVTVKNTGDVAGKDVVQLYFTPPYTNGGIEKASVNLVEFGKTDLLKPGASQKLTFEIPLEDLASYDSSCIKTANGGYILEAGTYQLSVRADSHTVLDAKDFEIGADIDYSESGRPSDKAVPTNRFDYMDAGMQYLSRKDGFANYAKVTAPHADTELAMTKELSKSIEGISVAKYKPTKYDNAEDVMPTMGADNGLKLADLTGKSYDDPMWEQLLDQMSLEDMIKLINEGGWKTVPIASVGKIATSDCDGPAGLSNYVTHNMGTQFPTEVMMAQTWNKELAEEIGSALGQEFAEAKNYGWYGPAVNLHRSAFSGRNFEYFSEDGVLSGNSNAIKNGYTTIDNAVLSFDAYVPQSRALNFQGVDFNEVTLPEGTELPAGYTLEGGVLTADGTQSISSFSFPVVLAGIDGYLTMNANVDVNVIDPIHVSSNELKVGETADITIDAPSYPYGSLVTMTGAYNNTMAYDDGTAIAGVEGNLFGSAFHVPGTGEPVAGALNIFNWYWTDKSLPYGATGYESIGAIPVTNATCTDARVIEIADMEAGNYYQAYMYGYTVSDEDAAKLAEFGLTLDKVMTDSGAKYDVNTALHISGNAVKSGTVEIGVTLTVPLVRGFGSAFPNNVKTVSPCVVEIPSTITLTIGE